MDTTAFIAEINKIPPVTRILLGSSLAVTLPVILQFMSMYSVIYHYTLVFEHLEACSSNFQTGWVETNPVLFYTDMENMDLFFLRR